MKAIASLARMRLTSAVEAPKFRAVIEELGTSQFLPQLHSRGFVNFSKLFDFACKQDIQSICALAQIWEKCHAPILTIQDDAWSSLLENCDFTPDAALALLRVARGNAHDSPLGFVARVIATGRSPELLEKIQDDVKAGSRGVHCALMACALPQPAFLLWTLQGKNEDLNLTVPKVVVEKECVAALLQKVWNDKDASLLIPGLCHLASDKVLESLDLSQVYSTHGNITGSIILSVLASRNFQVPLLADPDDRVRVVQAKIAALAPRPLPAATKPGWLGIFSDWIGTESNTGKEGIKILALDGGGTRSLVTAAILEQISIAAGGKRLCDVFDVIVGTSAGGLLAIGLGCQGMSVADSTKLVLEVGSDVFAPGSYVESLSRLWSKGERHSSNLLTKKAKQIFGELTLAELSALNGSKCKVAVVATNAASKPAELYLFRNFHHRPNSASRYGGSASVHPAWVAARATTAAPTYFAPIRAEDKLFQDGALLANNPTHVALHEATRIFANREVGVVVSVGTGRCPWESDLGTSTLFHGIARDLGTLIYSATSTEATSDILQDILSAKSYFRFQPVLPNIVEIDESRPHVFNDLLAITDAYIQEPAFASRMAELKKLLTPNDKSTRKSKL